MFFKTTKFLFSSLILGVSILTFSLPQISVKASTGPEFVIVNSPRGVNIRNRDCQIVSQAGYGQILSYNESGNSRGNLLYCTVNGQKLAIESYGNGDTNMFVASKHIQMVNQSSGTYTTQDKVKLSNYMGNAVNLRDDKCQRIMTLPNGTYSENFPNTPKISLPNGAYGEIRQSPAPDIVCKVGGEFYLMINFFYKNKGYKVAKSFIKFE